MRGEVGLEKKSSIVGKPRLVRCKFIPPFPVSNAGEFGPISGTAPLFCFRRVQICNQMGGGREGGKRISLPHQTTSQKKGREKVPLFPLLFLGSLGAQARRGGKIAHGRKETRKRNKIWSRFILFFPCPGNGRNIAAQERGGNLLQDDDGLSQDTYGKENRVRRKRFYLYPMICLNWHFHCFET